MAIRNLGDKISKSDMETVRNLRNPPEYEPGYEGTQGGQSSQGGGNFDGLEDGLFDSLDDSVFGGFGDTNTGGQQGNPGGQSSFGNFGSQGGFNNNNNFGQQGLALGQNPFGVAGANQQPQQPDALDKMLDASGNAAVGLGNIILELFKSLKNRNADDFGYLSRNLIIIGGICIAAGLILSLAGAVGNIDMLRFAGFPSQVFLTGTLTVGTGLVGIGFAALKISKSTKESRVSVQELPDVAANENDDATNEYEDHIGDILDDLFGDSGDSDLLEDEDKSSDDWGMGIDTDNEEDEKEAVFSQIAPIDYDKELESVESNSPMSRRRLFETFKPFLPLNTPNFSESKAIDSDDPTFIEMETLALKALSNVARMDLKDMGSRLESLKESFFSFELKLTRIRGVNKIDEIAKEVEAYLREGSDDTTVNATVDIEGDFYKIIVTKGESAIVTFGDVFQSKKICDYYLDESHKLPVIMGIDELGHVLTEDAKIFDSMLIAGKPRSGKSWYVLGILMSLVMFNSPEDVEFVIVDPKESNLFKTFALLPHVVGLHNDSRILDIMDDLIENEAPRRKKLLSDNRCDDIWDLRKKGVKIPVLYLVIDEYITVKNNLGAQDKELDAKMQTIISQLPSLGVRVIFVPHRATGIVNRTNRTMINFTASVRGDIEDVKDTLGIPKWTRSLTKPGDVALKAAAMQSAVYVRGAALTTSDSENTQLIRTIAKAFYKMGVDIPDNSFMKVANNRDDNYIREELQEDGHRVQFSTLNLDKVD